MIGGKMCHSSRRGCKESLLSESVADTANGFDQLTGCTEFPAQGDNLNVDRAFGNRVIGATNTVYDLIASEDPAWPLGEQVQDLEFR